MSDTVPRVPEDEVDPYAAEAEREPIRHFFKRHFVIFLVRLLASQVIALTGAYVLWQFHTTLGLVIGVVLVVTAVAIALPKQLRAGAQELREDIPAIVEAVKGITSSDKPGP